MAALAASSRTGDPPAIRSKIVSVGPFKVEFVWTNVEASKTVKAGTFESHLQRPVAALTTVYSAIAFSNSYATVSGKDVTVGSLATEESLAVMIIGF
jgi:hypothetical protein